MRLILKVLMLKILFLFSRFSVVLASVVSSAFVMVMLSSLAHASLEQDALARCASHPVTARSSSCLQWTSLAAVNSLRANEQFKNHIQVPLLMCIFREEIGSFDQYAVSGGDEDKYCTSNGCGLSQMTGQGVQQVQSALKIDELMDAWNNYWERMPHDKKTVKKPENLVRKDAMNPFYGVMMASLHLCNEIRTLESRGEEVNVYKLAYNYNGHPKFKEGYAKSVDKCVRERLWTKTASESRGAGLLNKSGHKNTNSSKNNRHVYSQQRKDKSSGDGRTEVSSTKDGRIHVVYPGTKKSGMG